MTLPLDKDLSIPQLKAPFVGTIRIPGSKSLTNRALCLAALAKGESILEGALSSNDTQRMIEAWTQLGVEIRQDAQGILSIKGCNGSINACTSDIYCENAGTAMRFLTAILALGSGVYRLTGDPRMYERPIKDLIEPLNSIGCHVEDERGTGCPPLKIEAKGFPGGEIELESSKSSQYLSAVMMTAPYARENATRITLKGSLVSRSYIQMTAKIMKDFGVDVYWEGDNRIEIPSNQSYKAQTYQIEGDASSASYFFVAAAITEGDVTVKGINLPSTQGDLELVTLLEKMGCIVERGKQQIRLIGRPMTGITADMNTMSDVAMSLAIAGVFAKGKTTINNVANMRIKECDRINAICTELKNLGVKVEEWDDGFSVEGLCPLKATAVETYNDHRMAMSLSLIGLKIPGLIVKNPSCVSKTFPSFFDALFSFIQN